MLPLHYRAIGAPPLMQVARTAMNNYNYMEERGIKRH